MKKRTLLTVSAVFAFLLLLALAVFAGAEETPLSGECGETATWRFEEETGTLYIEGSGEMEDYSTEEPAPWSEYKENIANVVFSDEITTVGAYSFIDCVALEAIAFPDNVSINSYAFKNCISISCLDLKKIVSIGSNSFYNCDGLKELIFPGTHTITLKQYSFSDCDGLQYVVLDNISCSRFAAKEIFKSCDKLQKVELRNLTELPNRIFIDCTSLTDVIIDCTLDGFSELARTNSKLLSPNPFLGCSSLQTVTFGENCNCISNYICCNLKSLTTVYISENVHWISEYAFYGCRHIKAVVFAGRECDIESISFRDVEFDCTFYGYYDSEIEAYCERKNIRFKYIFLQGNDVPEFSDIQSCADYIRDMAVNREKVISFCDKEFRYWDADSFKYIVLQDHVFDTLSPNTGDYLRWSIPCMALIQSDAYFDLYFVYYTTAEQEAELDEKISELLPSIITDGMTDYEKTKAIFDYLRTVEYAEPDEESDDADPVVEDMLRTAYSALVNGKANCQGFAQAFYRLALEAGLNARIVVNNAIDHAWNIVELDGVWYHLDASSAVADTSDYEDSYFLKNALKVEDISLYPGYGYGETPVEIAGYPFAEEDYCTHTFTLTEDIPSTCIALGYGVYTCPKCGDSVKRPYTVYGDCVDENGDNLCDVCEKTICEHSPVIVNAKEATCSEAGYTGNTVCEYCGKTLFIGETIPKLPHTDENNDNICDVCENKVCDHTGYDIEERIRPATCTELGLKYYVCVNCGETVFEGAELPLADHTDADADGICDNCGESVNLIRNIFYRFRLGLKTITNLLKKLIKLFTSL